MKDHFQIPIRETHEYNSTNAQKKNRQYSV